MNVTYRVLKIDQATQIMKIAREDVMDATCPRELVNTTFNYTVYDYTSAYTNITFLYGCPVSVKLQSPSFFSCGSKGYDSVDVVSGAQGPGNCNYSVVVPVLKTGTEGSVSLTHLDQLLQEGFEVRWKMDGKACSDCTRTCGRCGYSFSTNQTTCFCPGQPYLADSCSATKRDSPGPGMQICIYLCPRRKTCLLLLDFCAYLS
ncbi:putative serine/threonine-protein kinase [Heracleum sosnowskyi]|uniref:Serine/threonine-protein kinase n=1 Tax=Heracleum sosnowskyi TaxID=360622 RepID=A0AAD8H193_9APIA|nr:putative serine/threonine-protein kinase [Heracleum sosnowskyi]